MGVEAIVGGLFGLASAGISAASTHHAVSSQASAQASLNEKTMSFNRTEAEKARNWQASQSSIDRSYNSAEALAARSFTAAQAKQMMDFNAAEAVKARQFDAQQTLLARQFEERMSSTAHQREVADLKAAGLNPILSATGGNGASTPVAPVIASPMASGGIGSSAQASHSGSGAAAASIGALQALRKGNGLGEFFSSALDLVKANAELKRAEAEDKIADAYVKESVQRIEESISRVGLNMDQHEINQIRKMSEQELVNKLRAEISEVVTRTTDNHELSKAQKSAVMINANAYAGLASAQARLADIKGQLESAKNPAEIKRLEAMANQAQKSADYYSWVMSDPESVESRKYFEANPQLVPIREAINDVSKLFKINIGAHGLFSIGSDNSYQGTRIGF